MFCAWCATPVPAVSYTLCSHCGRPTNGAQAVPVGSSGPARSGGGNAAVIIIGIVVGGFVVIAIIGILAAIAIPNLLTAMQRSKQKRTAAGLLSVATAVESYAADKNEYPKVSSIGELRPFLVPAYIKTFPEVDGWGAKLRYECTEEKDGKCTGYAIGSGAKDLIFEHAALRDYLGSSVATTNFDCDLVYANGAFVEYPEGFQGRR
jgi:hypothetical protein